MTDMKSATLISGEAALSGRRRRSRLARYFSRSPGGVLGVTLITLLVLLAIFAPWLAPRDPYFMDTAHRLEAPGNAMPLGSDEFGRDILSRIIYGSRISIAVGDSGKR